MLNIELNVFAKLFVYVLWMAEQFWVLDYLYGNYSEFNRYMLEL